MIPEDIELRVGDRVLYSNKVEEIILFEDKHGESGFILITYPGGWLSADNPKLEIPTKYKTVYWVARCHIDMIPTFPYRIKV